MQRFNLGVVIAAPFLVVSITGCYEKSVEYYASHKQEAYEALVECQKMGSDRYKDKNCSNARQGYAIALSEERIIQGKADEAAIERWINSSDSTKQPKVKP